MKRRGLKSLSLIVAIMLIALAIAGCTGTAGQGTTGGGSAPTPPPATDKGSAAGGGVITIGISLDNLDDPYWVGLQTGMNNALDEIGAANVKADVQICQGDANLQAKQIQDMLTAGVNAIVCVYVDMNAIKQSVKLCNEKGVPFIFADRPVESTADAQIAWGMNTDDFALSKQGWEWMVDYAKKTGVKKLNTLELVGSLTDANVLKRTKGFEEVMAANPDLITRVQSVPTEWNLEKASAGVTNAMQSDPEINCIFMHSDVLLAPTIQSLETAGLWKKIGEPGHISVMPYSGNTTSLESIRDGYVEMCFGMNTIKIGHDTVQAAYDIAKGDKTKWTTPVADPGFLITMDNFKDTAPMAYGYAGLK